MWCVPIPYMWDGGRRHITHMHVPAVGSHCSREVLDGEAAVEDRSCFLLQLGEIPVLLLLLALLLLLVFADALEHWRDHLSGRGVLEK